MIRLSWFLQKEILGLVDDAESINEDAIGLDAFNFDKGYDLIIEVTQKGEWNDYGLKFARNATAIDVDMNQLEEDCKALDIDSEVKESSEEDLQKYFNRFVLDIDGDSADVSIEADTPAPPKKSNDVSDDVMNLMDDLNMNGDTEESSDSSDDSSDDNTLDEIQDLLADLDA